MFFFYRLQASDGEKSDQDLVVDDASEVCYILNTYIQYYLLLLVPLQNICYRVTSFLYSGPEKDNTKYI